MIRTRRQMRGSESLIIQHLLEGANHFSCDYTTMIHGKQHELSDPIFAAKEEEEVVYATVQISRDATTSRGREGGKALLAGENSAVFFCSVGDSRSKRP